MRLVCCACGKQVVSYYAPPTDPYVTIREGAKAGFNSGECFCGYCAKDLDENGLFPEEANIEKRMANRLETL